MDEDELFGGFQGGNAKKRQKPADDSGRPPSPKKQKPVAAAPPAQTSNKAPSNPAPAAIATPKAKEAKVQLSADAVANEDKAEPEVIRKKCTHDVCLPPNFVDDDPLLYDPAFPEKPTRTYPFVLDPFQRTSISCIERKESVLVSAHTSAGKTVIAEYAIAVALRDGQRVIYTSPIKALSNQKYRELYEIFSDVGLMTGDITINPNASCLVMTTEILRNMLYKGSEVMREIAWVVFDEIHYMRDKERGVVWEETLILLPDKVRYVFLSATIPNAREFASWIAKLHNQVCHVVYTDYRPTPLQHYIFPAGGEGLYLVVNEKGEFKDENFSKALSSLAPKERTGIKNAKGAGTKGPSDAFKIVKMIMDRKYEPVIVFNFSKRDCEALAMQVAKLDLNTDDEKKLVESVFFNAIDSLSEDDKKLPQVETILPLLKRGIGIHHGGLLPILKEVIEILFQEGLIKSLFATETFSIGLNMPAKTVVFNKMRKFDGRDFRWISGGEYIQMSGRAGRRGLDDRGIVIMMVDEKMEPDVAKSMVKGTADPLNSSFWISYSMMLNLLRIEEINPEGLLLKSFHQYQYDRTLPDVQKKLTQFETEKVSIRIQDEEAVADYYNIRTQLQKLKQDMRAFINKPMYAVPFLQPGRLVSVTDGQTEWGWGVVVSFQKKVEKGKQQSSLSPLDQEYIVDVLLHCASTENNGKPVPCPRDDKGVMKVVPVLLTCLDNYSALRLNIPKNLVPADNRLSVLKSIKEAQKRFASEGGLPPLDPVEDMKITDSTFKKIVRKIEALEGEMEKSKFLESDNQDERYKDYERKEKLDAEIKVMKKQLKGSGDSVLKEDLKSMKRVLKRLDFTSSDDVVETKGRLACELNAGDTLVLTEIILGGMFNELDVEQSLAILSCFICEEMSKTTAKIKDELAGPFRQLQETARRVAKISQECKVALDPDEYAKKFAPDLMEVVFAWAKGAKFVEVMKLSSMFEGNVIRCMRRLEELLRQLTSAAKSIGNTELEAKFAEGITKIKRDIVFAASLYL